MARARAGSSFRGPRVILNVTDKPAAPPLPGRRRMVLLIDEDTFARRILRWFEQAGWPVRAARSPTELATLAREVRAECVLVAGPLDAGGVTELLGGARPTPDGPANDVAPEGRALEDIKGQHIRKVLLELHGNVSAAARALGIDRRSLQRWMRGRVPGPAPQAAVPDAQRQYPSSSA
jgi:ActR/RegA family two-component response regulator